MSDFMRQFPNRLDVLSLETDDLAAILLEYLHSIRDRSQREHVMRTSFIRSTAFITPGERYHEVAVTVIEAWQWLIQHRLVVPSPHDERADSHEFSRRGVLLRDRRQVADFQQRLRCPKELLHDRLVESAWPIFLRGEYDTSVFQAFKEVEVAVRQVGGFTDADYGKDLMRKAFRPETPFGPLSDPSEPQEEQKSLQELFAGAYGRTRNPTAHRHGVLTDPTETFELLVLASHLLRVVDRRRPT